MFGVDLGWFGLWVIAVCFRFCLIFWIVLLMVTVRCYVWIDCVLIVLGWGLVCGFIRWLFLRFCVGLMRSVWVACWYALCLLNVCEFVMTVGYMFNLVVLRI